MLCSNLGLQELQALCDQLAAADLGADAKTAAVGGQLAAVAQAQQREQAQRDAATQVRGGAPLLPGAVLGGALGLLGAVLVLP